MNNKEKMQKVVSHLQIACLLADSNPNWEDWELESLRNRFQNWANAFDLTLKNRTKPTSQADKDDDFGRYW